MFPLGERVCWFERLQVEELDRRGAAEAPSSSSLVSPLRTSSCDLLSHTLAQPLTLGPHGHAQRGRIHLSDRKLSLQERSHSAASPGDPPGLGGRYIYPSLPYSPVTSPHTSPRLPRRPTVESHSVSITDLQVGWRRGADAAPPGRQRPLWPPSQRSAGVCLAFLF